MNLAGEMQKRCSECGADFECGMGQDAPCWCSREFAPIMPLPEPGADCYCARCLAKHIAHAPRKDSKGLP